MEAKQDLKDTLWSLAAFPYPQSPNPKRTVELAEKSVELMPKDGTIRLALGMAQYRAGNWQAALASMEKAMPLRDGGDPSDWLGLAMVHYRLGDEAMAAQWYEKARQWIDKHLEPPWLRLRAEAAEVLGRNRVLRSFKGHTDAIHGLAFSADGSLAITCSFDGTLRRWNLDSAKEEGCLKGHTGRVFCVALTPSGSRALSGGDDKTVRLWDVDTGEEIRQFLGHTAPVECVALSPDGKLAVSGGQDSAVLQLRLNHSGVQLQDSGLIHGLRHEARRDFHIKEPVGLLDCGRLLFLRGSGLFLSISSRIDQNHR